MPLRKSRGGTPLPLRLRLPNNDPLTSCLDANGTYICTAFNPRCFIIQKVTSTFGAFETIPVEIDCKIESSQSTENISSNTASNDYCFPSTTIRPELVLSEGYVYMNGDTGKLSASAVYPNSPEPIIANPSNVSMTASSISGIAAASIQTQQLTQSNTDFSTMNGAENDLFNKNDASNDSRSVTKTPDGSTIPIDQLKQMLSAQLDYYFSRENLANDTYLLTQMDNDQYVPIWTVANFNQVKKLTKDIKLITEVLRESPNVQVDEEGLKVRPNHKRCIVILREIPDNTPLEEVKNLFSGENCPRFISCEFAHNNSWYITFESDDDAQRAYRYLREEIKEFQGKPIMARIKAKPMNRLPIAPVQIPIKNGYRTTPPPTVFDPSTAAAFTTPQRFVYANGAPLPQGAVPYSGQVPIYPFQQQQYYPGIIQPWPGTAPPATQNFYELGSVFAANGLSPQVSFTAKPNTPRYNNHRNVRNKRTQQNEHRSSGSNEQTQAHQQHSHTTNHRSLNPSTVNQVHHQHHNVSQPQQNISQQQLPQPPTHHFTQPQPPQQQPQQQHVIFHQHTSTGTSVVTKIPSVIAFSAGGGNMNNNNNNNNNNNTASVMGGNSNLSSNNIIKTNDIHINKYAISKEDRSVTQSSHVPQHNQPHYHNTSHHHLQDVGSVHETGANNVTQSGAKSTIENEENVLHRTGASSKEQWPRYRRRRKDEENSISVRSTNSSLGANNFNPSNQIKQLSSPNPTTLRENATPVTATSHTNSRSSAQFDLEASAFPPLPGLDLNVIVNNISGPTIQTNINTIKTNLVVLETLPEVIPPPGPGSAAWGENRLADVVKGTAKSKNKLDKDYPACTRSNSSSPPITNINQNELNQNLNTSVQSLSLSSNPISSLVGGPLTMVDTGTTQLFAPISDVILHNSTVTMTPPFSPDASNKLNLPVIKYSTSDKSTKTEESLLNGSESSVIFSDNITSHPSLITSPTSMYPTAVNAATMTSADGLTSHASKPFIPVTTASTMTASVVKPQTQYKTQPVPVSKVNKMSSTSPIASPNTHPSNINLVINNSNNSNTIAVNSGILRSTSPNPPATVTTPISGDSGIRLSYAQVAQHHKERLLKDKQGSETSTHSDKEKQMEKENKRVDSPPNTRVSSQYNDQRERGDSSRDSRHGNNRKDREHRNSGGGGSSNSNSNSNITGSTRERRDGDISSSSGGNKNRSNRTHQIKEPRCAK